jgi:hypothetical protein
MNPHSSVPKLGFHAARMLANMGMALMPSAGELR